MTSTRTIGWRLFVAVLVACGAFPATARAQEPFDPGTRPGYASLGVGPSILFLAASGGETATGGFTMFKLHEEIGYHFSGDSSGLAIALNLEEAFGGAGAGDAGVTIFRFQPGIKFQYDAEIADSSFYVCPMIQVGYALWTASVTGGSGTAHFVNPQVGLEAKLIISDRGLVLLRPITLDMHANDDGFLMGWDLMMGGGLTF